MTRGITQDTLQASALPARVAYLIKEGSRAGFTRAVREASSRWAGMYEPILSVGETGLSEGDKQILRASGVSALVNVDCEQDVAEQVAADSHLLATPLAHIDHSSAARFSLNPLLLPDFPPETRSCTTTPELWEITAAGALTPEVIEDLSRNGYSAPAPSATADTAGRLQLHGHTLLHAATRFFHASSWQGLGHGAPVTIWITLPDSLPDCQTFWNFRAISCPGPYGHGFLLLPKESIEHWIGLDIAIHSYVAGQPWAEPDATICSESIPEEELRSIGLKLGFHEDTGDKISASFFMNTERRKSTLTFRANSDPRIWILGDRTYGVQSRVDFHFQHGSESRVRIPSPVPAMPRGLHLLRITSETIKSLPRSNAIAQEVFRDAQWNGESLEFGVHGAAYWDVRLNFPTPEKVMNRLLDEQVKAHSPSNDGRLAEALRARFESDILLQPGVMTAIAGLATPRSRQLLRLVTDFDIPERVRAELSQWGGRVSRRFAAPSQVEGLGESESALALELLASKGWVERCLAIDCDACKIKSAVSLSEVLPEARCPACGTVGSFRKLRTNAVAIVYRLNALIDRAFDQGVLPHVAAAAAMDRRNGQPIPCRLGVDLTFHDESQSEIDLFGYWPNGEVFAGEVKSSATSFTPEQIDRDIALCKNLGVDSYLMVCLGDMHRDQFQLAADRASAVGLSTLGLSGKQLSQSHTSA